MTLPKQILFRPKALLVIVTLSCLFPSQLYSNDKAAHLYEVATAQFGNAKITDDAASALRGFINSGVNAHPDAGQQESEDAIRRFAGAMLQNAHPGQVDGERTIDLSSFNSAILSVCPLYPIC